MRQRLGSVVMLHDVWSPSASSVEHDAGGGFEDLVVCVLARVREEAGRMEGSLVEAKEALVALRYRVVADADRLVIAAVVDRVLADRPGELKVTPGRVVYEIRPRVGWDRGRAVLCLLEVVGLEDGVVIAVCLGEDITGEDAFRALFGGGIGVFVGRADDPEIGEGGTSAAFVLDSIGEVERFLDALVR